MDTQKETPEVSKGTEQPSESNRERAAEGVPMQEEWRELVRQIQEEKDAHKLVSLVQELICKFDEEKSRKTMRRPGGIA